MAKAGPPNEIHREIQKKTCWCLCATESYEAPKELCFQSFSSPSEMLSIWTWEGEISPSANPPMLPKLWCRNEKNTSWTGRCLKT
jgi:hypothetical protein